MPTAHASNNVREHGIIIDEHKKRVRCNYCSKEMTTYSRLKQHLGGKGGDVVPCEQVPQDVKSQMNSMLSREVVQLFQSEILRKESTNPNSTSLKRVKESTNSNSTSLKRVHHEEKAQPVAKKKKPAVLDSVLEKSKAENKASQSPIMPPLKPNQLNPINKLLDSGNTANYPMADDDDVKKCIARFFYEHDIDFGAARSHTFQKMVGAIIKCGSSSGFEIPSSEELNVCIQGEMNDIHRHIKEVMESWKDTGCSILLDGWTDEKGRRLMNFLVDCPKGPIFLKSDDVSGSHDNVDAMVSLLGGVIEDVGVENVVQVVTYTASEFMEAVGKQLMEKYRTIFWTVCASHCISLMLDKIATMGTMEDVLSKAKTITQFIYSDDTLLRLLRKHTRGKDLIFSSRIKTTVPFLTLEKMVFESENLKALFGSTTVNGGRWRRVANLVEDPLFWADAGLVLKATIPLVRSLLLVSGEDTKPQMPYIYETMDQVKETIKVEFKSKKAKYMPYWQVIDGIWDNTLHSPLHSAGYFLNPSLFYSSDFLADAEVASGLLSCIVRMVEDRKCQDRVSLQLDNYRAAKGAFGGKLAIEQRTELPPGLMQFFLLKQT
ncbi:hypothetical protein ACHQM5_030639 [Ranunculus cassubicifolius]